MFLLMGSHLFSSQFLEPYKKSPIVMIEDWGLCTHYSYHKQKIAFFLDAMRSHRDYLKDSGFNVIYFELSKDSEKESFFQRLKKAILKSKNTTLQSFFIEDKFFREQIKYFCHKEGIKWDVAASPLFLNSAQEISAAIPPKKPLMRHFYESERLKKDILLTKDNKPIGGKYSFDEDNRLKMPKNTMVPPLPKAAISPHRKAVELLVSQHFNNHPGILDDCWLPTTRQGAQEWLDNFLKNRFLSFGPYEDAIDASHPFLFHSVVSPLMNCGLLTPEEVIEKSLAYAAKAKIPHNSVEGFVRQIIGWREFVRGIYEKFSDYEEKSNFFNHQRKITSAWYDGTTGIVPLDDAIKKAWRYGYCHHIERLMILSNIMLLCEIHPHEVHRWFMEMFVDSADWVMGPNVFGMGQMSDGGLFTTKPYICGSNYILKMSHYKKDDWCDILDGLYWRFIDKHRQFFTTQARSSMMPKMLDKMDKQRQKMLFLKAQEFIEQFTKKI